MWSRSHMAALAIPSLEISGWLRHDVLIEAPRYVNVVASSICSPETEIWHRRQEVAEGLGFRFLPVDNHSYWGPLPRQTSPGPKAADFAAQTEVQRRQHSPSLSMPLAPGFHRASLSVLNDRAPSPLQHQSSRVPRCILDGHWSWSENSHQCPHRPWHSSRCWSTVLGLLIGSIAGAPGPSLASTVHLYQQNQMQPLGRRRLHRVIDDILFLFGPGCQGSGYGSPSITREWIYFAPDVASHGWEAWCGLVICARIPFRRRAEGLFTWRWIILSLSPCLCTLAGFLFLFFYLKFSRNI